MASLKGEANLMVALEKIQSEKEVSDMSEKERLEFASSRKEVGGKHFKAQRYGLALQRYRAAEEIVSSFSSVPQEGQELRRICWLNQAACLLKLDDPRGAKSACASVLKDEPKNVKALFRRATACLALGENAEAKSDLRELLEVDTDNKEAQRLLSEAARNAKEDKQKSIEMVQKMNKAHDGDFAKEQAERMEIERNTLKPGQVLTVAQQEEAWEKAMESAKADMVKVEQMQARGGWLKGDPVCAPDSTSLDGTDVLSNATGRLHYVPSN